LLKKKVDESYILIFEERQETMETKKKFFPKKVFLYPAVVFVIGFLIAFVVPMLSNLDAKGFGHRIGYITGNVLVFAFFVGLVSDFRSWKKMKQQDGL